MEAQHEKLFSLEKVLSEFYNDQTTNDRKQQIELELNKFKLQYESWKECCYYIEVSHNIYVHMFSLTVLEDVIIRKWVHVGLEDKKFLLNKLKQFVSLQRDVSSFILKKNIKLIVDVARSDWPHSYPEFFSDIINLLLCSNTLDLGLVFIEMCCEELIAPGEYVCFNRKDELKLLFLQQIPELFHIFTSTLQNLVNVADHTLADKTLKSLGQLFSWVPTSSLYSVELMSSVYPYLYNDSRTQALSVLNEILYKICVPAKEVHFIVSICQHVTRLLSGALTNSSTVPPDENYTAKLIESIRLILSGHWHRVEANGEISPILELMTSFLDFTFRVQFTEQYYRCLEIWCTFVDYLKLRDRGHVAKYETFVFPSLIELVVSRLYSSQDLYNSRFSSVTDDDEDDDYEEFLNHNMKLVGEVFEITRKDITSGLVTVWEESAIFYLRLLESRSFANLSQTDLYQLHKFTVNTQILAVVCSYIDFFEYEHIVNKCVGMVITGNKCYLNSEANPINCASQFIHAHHELLVGLNMWLPRYSRLNKRDVVPELLTTCYPFIVTKNAKQNSKLVRAIVHLTCYLLRYNSNLQYFQPLLTDPSFSHLPDEIRLTLYCEMFNWVLNYNDKPDEQQTRFLSDLIEYAVSNYDSAATIIRNSKPKNIDCKKVLFKTTERWLQQIVFGDTFLSEKPYQCIGMMSFFAECFLILREYMHDYTLRAVQLFLQCLVSPTGIIESTTNGLETLMHVLTIVLQKEEDITTIIPYVINISVQQLKKEKFGHYLSQEIKFGIYQLLSSILLYNWTYITGVNEEHPDFANFDAILTVLLDFTCQGDLDINCIVYIIQRLETVNEKWCLYQKEFFKKKYLLKFQEVLLICLITKSYDLLSENIISLLFHMISVDFELFYRSFLVNFIEQQLCDLKVDQRNLLRQIFKEDEDLPSFQTTISRFINDLRCYRMINTTTFIKN